MAVVGTAYVIIRAMSKGLRKDIADGVEKAGVAASPAVERSGAAIGKKLGAATGDTAEKEIAKTVSGNPSRNRLKLALGKLFNAFRPDAEGRKQGNKFAKSLLSGIDEFKIPPMAWLAMLAVPAIGGALKVAGAYVSATISLVGAMGPAFAAAGAVAASGIFMLGGAVGAVMLAFKTDTPLLTRFKEVMTEVGKEFKVVGAAAQTELLPKLAQALGTLTAVIPTLSTGLSKMGGAVGGVAINIANTVTSSANLARLSTIFDSSARSLGFIGQALGSVLNAFIGIAAAGGPITEMFAAWIAKWGAIASSAVEAGIASGNLAAFLGRAGAVAAQLGGILGNTFGGLFAMFSASSASGQTLLDRLTEITAKFDNWAKSIGGQTAMKDFFASALPIVQAFNGFIGDTLKMLTSSIGGDSSGVIKFIDTMRTQGLPALQSLAQALSALGPSLVTMTTSIAGLFQQLSDSGALGTFTAAVVGVIDALSWLLSNPITQPFMVLAVQILAAAKAASLFLTPFGGLKILAGPLGSLFSVIGQGLSSLGGVLVNVASKAIPLLIGGIRALGVAFMTNPIGLIIGLVALLVTGIVIAYQKSDSFRAIVDKLGAAIMTGLGAALQWLIGIWNTVWPAMQTGWQWIQQAFATGVAFVVNIVSGIVDAWNATTAGFEAGWKWIQQAFATGVGFVVGVVDGIIGAWNSVVAGFQAGVSWIQNMFETLKPVFNIITQPIQGIIQVVTGFVDIIKGLFTGNWDEVTTGISNVVGGVVRFFLGMPARVIEALAPFIPGILAWIANVWNNLFAAVSAGISAVVAFFQALPTNILNAVISLAITLGTWMIDVWNSITTAVTTGVAAVISFFQALPGNLLAAVIALAGLMGEWMSNAWAVITGTVSAGIEATISFFATLPGRALAAVVSLIGAASAWMSSVWATVTGAVAAGIGAAISWFSQLPGRAISAVSSLAGQVGSWMGGVFATMSGAVSSGISAAASWFSGLPGRIMGAVGSLGSTLYSAGTSLLQGLINGINDMWGRVMSLASSLASKVGDTIKSALGINSPSKVTAKLGVGVGEGLVLGMSKMINPVGRMANQIAMAAVPDLGPLGDVSSSGLSGGAARSGNSGATVYQTVYYPVAEPTSTSTNRVLQLAASLGA